MLSSCTKTSWQRTLRKLDARSYEVVSKADGKVTTTTRVVVAADGRTMTQTTTGTNAQGQKVSNVTVWDRQ